MVSPQVQQLLDVMHLSQYKEVFKSTQIDGELLTAVDECDLQEELGVHSKLHRLRLLKVARGSQSIQDLIQVT